MGARPKPIPDAPLAPAVKFFTSGSLMFDLVLGGKGWAQGRMANLVGDKSTGKTLLAIEACANIAQITRPEYIRYAEAEAAFDEAYATTIGLPSGIRLTEPGGLTTVEDFYVDLNEFLDTLPGGDVPAMYVLDSLDSLSSKAELERDFDAGSYGDGKAKQLSKMFRITIQKVQAKNCMLLIISQIRDKLNVTFGETKTRSGGHALDFYASQIVWLAQVKTLKKEYRNTPKVYGVQILARNKKCKVGTGWAEAELPLLFNYGMDDENSMIDWLGKTKVPIDIEGERYDAKQLSALVSELRTARDRESIKALNGSLREFTRSVWDEIEGKFKQPLSKYGT